MKTKSLITTLILLTATTFAATPLHHYTFDSPGVIDSIGTADGALQNGAAVASGKLNLDGIDDYVQFSQHIIPTTGTFSIAFFAQEVLAHSTYTELISQDASSGGRFYIDYDPSHNFRIGDGLLSTGIHFPSDGLRHHYAVTVGSDTRLYIDGSLVGTFGPISITGGGNHTRLGCQYNTPPSGSFFNGNLEDLWVFGNALTTNEVASLATGIARPYITSQPQSQLGYWGQNASFSVGALPLPLNYQWQSNGVAITGATNQTLTLTNLQNSFAAGYTVVVANSYGSVTSAPPANLTINPAGVAIALYPGVKIDGVVGLTYGIQYSTNLANTNSWIGRTNLTLSVPSVIWSDYQPSPAQTFYRVLQGPIPIP